MCTGSNRVMLDPLGPILSSMHREKQFQESIGKRFETIDCVYIDFSIPVMSVLWFLILFGIQCLHNLDIYIPVHMINIGTAVSDYCILYTQEPVIFIYYSTNRGKF